MKTCHIIYLFGGAFAVWLTGGLWAQESDSDSPQSTTRQAWEHLALENVGSDVTRSQDLARKINSLGNKGWELVDVESITRDGGATKKTVYFFKRRK